MMLFADAARRLAGVAGLLFGWRPEEFWNATPAELATLVAVLAPDAPPDLGRLMEMFPDE